jgi:hypothetical protein
MVDPIDVYGVLVLGDPVEDAVCPNACCVPARELPSKWVSDPMWVDDETAEAELDHGTYETWRGLCETVELTD